MLRPLIALTLLFTGPASAATCDAVWRDAARARDLPVRIRLPDGSGKVPALLWSPGLGGSRTGGEAFARAWASAGFAVIQLEHPGSDAAVYAGTATPEERRQRVMAAASGPQLIARTADVSFIADELERRPTEGACALSRIDRDRLALAGHSMGAWTVQAIAGQRFGPAGITPTLIDRRFRAFIAFSPNANPSADPTSSFGQIGRPFLAITGTQDGVPLSGDPALRQSALAQRTRIFTGLPADGRKAIAILADATHMMFAGNLRDTSPLAVHVRTASITLSTAWLRHWLLDDAGAERVLAKPPLGPDDQWQRK